MGRIKRPSIDTTIPSASMADVAFLLLIFFISTTVLSLEEGLTLVLPPRGGAKKQVSRKDVLVLRIDADSRVHADELAMTDVSVLSDLVRERLRNNDRLVVSIESHSDARYKTMIRVLDEVQEAEAPRISIKTAGDRGG
jgi:biopolymer transport protein ExbD